MTTCRAWACNRLLRWGAVHGNALDLEAFPDAAFDAVLLMGPMYHLLEAGEGAQALAEAHRVLRPGGTPKSAPCLRGAALPSCR